MSHNYEIIRCRLLLVSSSIELNTHAKKVTTHASEHARREKVATLAPQYCKNFEIK